MEHSIDVRVRGVPFRITATEGTLHFGAGWLEVRRPGANGLNFCGVSVRANDDIRECVERLNRQMVARPQYQGIEVSAVQLVSKEEKG
jgi:hypothetical protein